MKLVRIFSALAILLVLLFFLIKNNDIVSIDLLFQKYDNVTVSIVMLGALAIGIIIGYGVALTLILTAKAEIRAIRTKNRQLSEELNNLRNVAIDEGIYDIDDRED